ncbi:DUF4157 domain-containing protein [Moorena producens]|uniref:eCIS core domain-containing protein n=1 Tax=Moorena producens TaxID=1155739 RepID=UPI003C74326A
MRTTHTYKPKYSHSTSLTIAQKKKDDRRKGIREILDAEEREWNAEEAVGEWGSISAKVMRTLESGEYQPETGRRDMGLQGKFSFGQPGDRSRQGENHGGHQVVQPKRMMVQRAAQPLTGDSVTYGDRMRASSSIKVNKTGLPDRLKAGIENLSGYSMDDVRVHYNSDKPAQLQALAYAQGTEIHVGPGQERHLPHEAWHVVQQKQGRVKPTTLWQGLVQMNLEPTLEADAEVMGKKALTQGEDPRWVDDSQKKLYDRTNDKERVVREGNVTNVKVVQRVRVDDKSDGLKRRLGYAKSSPGEKQNCLIDNKEYCYHFHPNNMELNGEIYSLTMTLWRKDWKSLGYDGKAMDDDENGRFIPKLFKYHLTYNQFEDEYDQWFSDHFITPGYDNPFQAREDKQVFTYMSMVTENMIKGLYEPDGVDINQLVLAQE